MATSVKRQKAVAKALVDAMLDEVDKPEKRPPEGAICFLDLMARHDGMTDHSAVQKLACTAKRKGWQSGRFVIEGRRNPVVYYWPKA